MNKTVWVRATVVREDETGRPDVVAVGKLGGASTEVSYPNEVVPDHPLLRGAADWTEALRWTTVSESREVVRTLFWHLMMQSSPDEIRDAVFAVIGPGGSGSNREVETGTEWGLGVARARRADGTSIVAHARHVDVAARRVREIMVASAGAVPGLPAVEGEGMR